MRSLQGRLVLAFLFVILFVLCVVSGTLLLILRQAPQQDRIELIELSAQARAFAALAERQLDARPSAVERQLPRLDQFAERLGVRAAILDADGTVQYDTQRIWDRKALNLLAELKTTRSSTGLSGRVRDTDGTWLTVAQPFPRSEGYLALARSVSEQNALRRFRDTLLSPLVRAGLAALAIGIVLSALVTHSIARPLRQVASAANAISSGDLKARATAEGPAEVRSLAQAFNEMADQVQASQQAQRDLVANIAHDLRTPLTSVQGYAQALLDGTAAHPEAVAQAAAAIHEEAQRMHRMTRTLLDLARFEAGQIALEKEPVDLVALAQHRIEMLVPLAEEKRVDLRLASAADCVVLGDAQRLEQVLDNLIQNALTHTAPEGHVGLHIECEPGLAEIAVIDDGQGIAPEDLPRIFERFYRGDRSRHGPGTGLGLAIVKEIVAAHGGTITVDSALGVGTRFFVRLPRSRSN